MDALLISSLLSRHCVDISVAQDDAIPPEDLVADRLVKILDGKIESLLPAESETSKTDQKTEKPTKNRRPLKTHAPATRTLVSSRRPKSRDAGELAATAKAIEVFWSMESATSEDAAKLEEKANVAAAVEAKTFLRSLKPRKAAAVVGSKRKVLNRPATHPMVRKPKFGATRKEASKGTKGALAKVEAEILLDKNRVIDDLNSLGVVFSKAPANRRWILNPSESRGPAALFQSPPIAAALLRFSGVAISAPSSFLLCGRSGDGKSAIVQQILEATHPTFFASFNITRTRRQMITSFEKKRILHRIARMIYCIHILAAKSSRSLIVIEDWKPEYMSSPSLSRPLRKLLGGSNSPAVRRLVVAETQASLSLCKAAGGCFDTRCPVEQKELRTHLLIAKSLIPSDEEEVQSMILLGQMGVAEGAGAVVQSLMTTTLEGVA